MAYAKLAIVLSLILAVDIAWLNIHPHSFVTWGWIVVSAIGFAAGIWAGVSE